MVSSLNWSGCIGLPKTLKAKLLNEYLVNWVSNDGCFLISWVVTHWLSCLQNSQVLELIMKVNTRDYEKLVLNSAKSDSYLCFKAYFQRFHMF